MSEFAASFGRLVGNHLWQSTGFAAVAVLLALALKVNHARARYWLWLAASVKFLVPFSALAAIGGTLGRWLVPATPVSRVPLVMQQIVQPFAPVPDVAVPVAAAAPAPSLIPTALLALWLCGFFAVLLYGWVRWRRVAAAVRSAKPLTEGREIEAWGRLASRLTDIRLVSSTAKLEPGVFGIFRPVLWLPAGIGNRLEDAELEAILAHELCHVRRRDNLLSVIHMAVEALFWFHPLVWWLGARLEEERERACDEEVVRMGGEPQIYAESILKVCEFYLASPVACAAGVTGGELKKRIEGIMTNQFARNLSHGKKMLLASAAILAAAGPVVLGVIGSPVGQALAQRAPARKTAGAAGPSFEVASVRLSDPKAAAQPANVRERGLVGVGGRFDMPRINLTYLVMRAFDVESRQISGPNWMNEQTYDVFATAPAAASSAQIPLMFQSLLVERFKMRYHLEDPVTQVYALVVTPGGSKLKAGQPDDDPLNYGQIATKPAAGGPPVVSARTSQYGVYRLTPANGIVHYEYLNITMKALAQFLGREHGPLELPVVDMTGLSGEYQATLDIPLGQVHCASSGYPTDQSQGEPVPMASDPCGSTIRASLEKQGLRLVRRSIPYRKVVIDSMERTPTEN
jgi:uncharacterized protein (TIGR03435 family)